MGHAIEKHLNGWSSAVFIWWNLSFSGVLWVRRSMWRLLFLSLDRGRKIVWPWWCWGTFSSVMCLGVYGTTHPHRRCFACLADLTYIPDVFVFIYLALFSFLLFSLLLLFPFLFLYFFISFIPIPFSPFFLCWSLLPLLSRRCLILFTPYVNYYIFPSIFSLLPRLVYCGSLSWLVLAQLSHSLPPFRIS